MDRTIAIAGAVCGFFAVAAGAFGAHALRQRLGPNLMEVFEVAVQYHFYHSFALVASAWFAHRFKSRTAKMAGWCFGAGIVLFSGSLYLLALTEVRWLGAVTPFGGLAFLAGWGLLAVSAARSD